LSTAWSSPAAATSIACAMKGCVTAMGLYGMCC
jgi:hypothetical protein